MKKVVIELKTQAVVDVPDDWDTEMIEFHFNESSHCLSTELMAIGKIAAAQEEDGRLLFCGCQCTEVTYLRDAQPQDEEATFSLN